jgi:hypothetical protein
MEKIESLYVVLGATEATVIVALLVVCSFPADAVFNSCQALWMRIKKIGAVGRNDPSP